MYEDHYDPLEESEWTQWAQTGDSDAEVTIFLMRSVLAILLLGMLARRLWRYLRRVKRIEAPLRYIRATRVDLARVLEDSQDVCSICLGTEGSSAVILECGHWFHPECLSPWLSRSSACPVCRHKIEDADNPGESTIHVRLQQNHAELAEATLRETGAVLRATGHRG